MPSRTISTKVAIEGESAYRQAISSLNSSLKTLSTELAKVKSENRDQLNSMEALKAKGDVLNSMYEAQRSKVEKLKDALGNAKKAQQEHTQNVEDAKAKIAAAEKELEGMSDTTEDAAKKQEALAQEIDKLNKQMEYEQAAADSAQKGVDSWQQQLNKAEIQLDDLDEELEKNEKYLKEASESADGCATSIDEYGKEVKTAGDESEDFGDKSKGAVDALASALAAAGLKETFEKITEAIRVCVDASIEYESAFAGVRKTVDATEEQFAELSDGIKNLSTIIPASTTELNGVAEAAGQLGIKTENILAFTEVMTNLGVATNLSADEAASALAKFSNVVKMSPQDYDRLGSTIVALGNNFATTEADIVAMATRLASTGAVVGLSESQIMAVATALSSLGIEAEAGGSAVSKLMKKMETAAKTYDQANSVIKQTGMSLRDLELLADADSKAFKGVAQDLGYTSTELKAFMKNAKSMEQFSSVAGMSAREFQQAWGQDAVRAMDMFVTGLGKMDESGTSAITVLNDMGLTEVRLSNAVLSMAKSDGVLTDALDLANVAWEENNALTKEAEQRYGTTESKIQLAKNSLNLLKVAVGDELTPAIGKFAEMGGNAAEWATEMVQKCEWLMPTLTALTTVLGIGTAAVVGYTAVVKLAGPALAEFNAALLANPTTAVVVGVVALTAAIIAFAAATGDAENEVSDYTESLEESRKAHEEAVSAIEDESEVTLGMVNSLIELAEKENKSTAEKGAMLSMVDELNAAIPELNLAYDEQTDSLNMTSEALLALVETQYEYARQQANIERYAELYAQQREGADLLATAQDNLTAAQAAYDAAVQAADPSLVGYSGELEVLAGNVTVAQSNVDALTAAQETNQAEMDALSGTIETYATKTEEAAGTTADLSTAVKETTDEISQNMQDLQDSYWEAYGKASESIEKQMGLLSNLDLTAKTKVTDIIASLQSQIDFMNEYAADINKAMEYGIDEGLVQQLSDGSEESAAILRGIVDDGGKHVTELNEKLAEVQQGKTDFARNIAEMQTGFSEKVGLIEDDIDGLVAEMDKYNQASENGKQTMQGYIDGLNSKMSELQNILAQIDAGNARLTAGSSGNVNGKHAEGLSYVPFDGYVAELHKGERVLTADEAQNYIDNAVPSDVPGVSSASSSSVIRFGDITVIVEGNADEDTAANVAESLADEFERKLRYRGVI